MCKKIFFFLLCLLFLAFNTNRPIFSEDPTPTPSPTATAADQDQIKKLQDQINEYQNKISDLQSQQKTLNSQIKIMDSQVKLTELRVADTQQKISNLQKDINVTKNKITTLESDISKNTEAMIGRISAVYKVGSVQTWQVFLTSDSLDNFMTRLKYLRLVQISDKKNIYASEQSKVNYANQQDILKEKQAEQQALKKQLEGYTAQLTQEKTAKESLLQVTKNDESKYQKLLQEARAQISGFKSFSSSLSGGQVSILPPQASPDGWYYNQRDERWGRNSIGGSSDQVWDVGCLLTSVAMVLKQRGESVTPADVASNRGYFFSDTAYMLLPWAGGRFTSVWGYDGGSIDSALSSKPVIVGVRAGVYGMHFVVLKSGSGGNYQMNDPWYGPNLNFTDYYSTSQIFQYGYMN